MTGSMQVSAIVNGKSFTSAVHEWAVDGVIRNGIAEASRDPGQLVDNRAMPVFAISDNSPLARAANRRQFLKFVDKAGVSHDFVVRTGGKGGPLSSLVHLENGEIVQSLSYEWRKVRGGWKAEGVTVTAFKDGKPAVTVRSGTKLAPKGPSMMMGDPTDCYLDPNCDPWTAPGGAGGGAGGGSGGAGGTSCSCTNEMMAFLGLGWTVGMTTGQLLTATATTIWQWGGLGGAYVMLSWLAIRWVNCEYACSAGLPSGGGGGSGWTILSNPPAMIRTKDSP
jgi:hypothetical protein